jgi:Cd2+/Zn2+-exporting ATPase
MNTNGKPTPEIASCGGSACSHCADDVAVAAPVPSAAHAAGVTNFRIATMDCASEEGEIRRALEPVAGIRLLRFQLGARTLTIDADPKDLHQALEAIRKAGFDPKPRV